MTARIPLEDGWHPFPGDEMRPGRTGTFFYFWAYIKEGAPIKVEGMPSPGKAPRLTDGVFDLGIYEKIWGESILEIFLKHYKPKSTCRWHRQSTGIKVPALLLGVSPQREEEINTEKMLMEQAKEDIRQRLRRTLREWPFCGRGGTVSIKPEPLRNVLQVEGIWECSCES